MNDFCFDTSYLNTPGAEKKLYNFYPLAFQAEGVLLLASVRLPVRPSVRKLYLVRTVTRHKFELESPNLHQTCITGYSRLVLKMEVIDLDLQSHFGHFTQNSRKFRRLNVCHVKIFVICDFMKRLFLSVCYAIYHHGPIVTAKSYCLYKNSAIRRYFENTHA